VAEVGVNFWSWGEKVSVEIDRGGTISVESRCRLPTQCFDWGKNQRNIDAFFQLVDEKSRQTGQTSEWLKGSVVESRWDPDKQALPDGVSDFGIKAEPLNGLGCHGAAPDRGGVNPSQESPSSEPPQQLS
jgi:hypothetical protein